MPNADDGPAPVPQPRDPRLIGLYLFLASLSMLFLAAIGGYAIIRYTGRYAPPAGTLRVPWLLLVSTALMIGSSLVLHLGLIAIRAGQERAFVRRVTLAAGLSLAFVAVQIPALMGLLSTHWAARPRRSFSTA